MDQTPRETRIPIAVGDIQVNFCKKPGCRNFGVPASTESQTRGPGEEGKDHYKSSSRAYDLRPLTHILKCQLCNETITIKSNQGIYEELQRLKEIPKPPSTVCKTPNCPNNAVPVNGSAGAYVRWGHAKSGSQRYRCIHCKKSISTPKTTARQRKPYKNTLILKLIVNKSPVRRICEVAGVNAHTLYRKIRFLYGQCRAFAQSRETAIEHLNLKRLNLAVDQQDHAVNWVNSANRTNMVINAIGAADMKTGYVFGMHANYDISVNPIRIQQLAEACGDDKKPVPFRRFARLWLEQDYMRPLLSPKNRKRFFEDKAAQDEVADWLLGRKKEADLKFIKPKDLKPILPLSGVQVHTDYYAYGYFFYLKELFKNVDKVRFYLDSDSLLKGACIGAFAGLIKDDRCDAFAVKINKNLTIDKKTIVLAEAKTELAAQRILHPDLDDRALALEIIKNGAV